MLRNMMIDVLRDTWPILVICSIIFVSMRIVYLVKSDKKIYIHKVGWRYKLLIGLIKDIGIEGADCILNKELLERI